tara:strand:+ start:2482 stop:3426 length:945 start_codon:yes stop_codon:yes gene_type:complete
MRILLTVFLLISVCTFGQTTRAVGQVVDAKTLEPLPYANIVLESKKRGISTDEEGRYSFVIKEVSENAILKFSYVGYESQCLELKELKGKVIKLKPSIHHLTEVKIFNVKNRKTKRINNFLLSESVGLGNFSGGQYPSTVARFYEKPGKFEEACYLKQVEIRYFILKETLSRSAKYRLRIMAVDKEGKPSYDLLDNGLIVEKEPGEYRTKIDLLPYKIRIPDQGFFIAVEHLFIKENAFMERKDYRVNDTMLYKDVELRKYAPIFKGVLEKDNEDFKSYYKDINGWRKMNSLDNSNSVFSGKLPAPAFKITLTD